LHLVDFKCASNFGEAQGQITLLERTHTSQRTFSDSAASTLRKALVTGLTGQLNPFVRFAHWPIIGLAAFNKTAAEAALDTGFLDSYP